MSLFDNKNSIPGTIIFDGKMSSLGYSLNKLCYSFNKKSARDEFNKNELLYCKKFKLTKKQITAILKRDILGLLRQGGSIYYLAKFAGLLGLNMQDIGALQTGLTLDKFKQKLIDAGK